MYKLYTIAKNNIKKQKGDMITFFILTFIAAFLVFDAVSALLGMGKVLDSRFEEVGAAHFVLINNDTEEEKECIEKAVREHKYMIDFERTRCLLMTAEHKNAKESDYGQYQIIAMNMSDKPKYMNDLPDGDKYNDNDILLPYYLQTTYKVGDTMNIKLGDNVYDFNVAGYVADPYFCSSVNITRYYTFISDKMFATLKDENPDTVASCYENKGVMDESYLSSDYGTDDLEKEITDSYKELLEPYAKEHPERPYSNYLAMNWQMMRGGSQFVPMIIMAVILLFAIIIIVIAIVIISFSIKNFIQRNMKNTGILEASGYTVKELRGALSFQIVTISLIGAILGTVLAMATFKAFGKVVSLAMGLVWNQPINILAGIITIVVPTFIIFLVSRYTSRIYKKVSVLDALRGGINTHNFKKNFFSFEKTPLPIPAVVSLKDTFGGLGRNIVMVIIVMILTMSVLLGFGMYENFGQKPEKLINILGFENATADVMTSEDIADELRDIEGVENVLVYYGLDLNVKKDDKEQSVYTFVMDDIENTLNLTILEGRTAKHNNEIMMTPAAAESVGAKCGDVVELEFAGEKAEYIISGIYQRMDRMGRTIYMNFEAADRILSGTKVKEYFVTADKSISFDDLKKEIDKIDEKYEASFEVVDIARQMDGTMGIVSTAMKILCIVIAVITILVVIFVESLVIRAKIVREWRGMGISKALGMTSGQLIAQIMMSNVPAILVGILIGTVFSQMVGGKLCVLIFSLFGIKHIDFNISIIWMILSAIGIIAVALIASGLSGLKVRILRPVEMITEE
jgi:ABC-type transport system, involved in lipoprotein release, permease component